MQALGNRDPQGERARSRPAAPCRRSASVVEREPAGPIWRAQTAPTTEPASERPGPDRRTTVASALEVHAVSGAHLDFYFTSLSGMTSARGSGPKSSPNLIGGRSWNMKSHFQRSDGFDACSQCRGRHRPREGHARRARRSRDVAPSSRAIAAADRLRRRDTPPALPKTTRASQDLPVFAGIARRRDGARRRLHVAGHVRVGRVLLDERGSRQHDVGGVGERRVQHALHDERLDLAGLARRDDPVGVADRAVRSRIEHVEHLHLAGLDGGLQRETSAGPRQSPDVEAQVARAAHVRRVDGGNLELRVGRLRLLASTASRASRRRRRPRSRAARTALRARRAPRRGRSARRRAAGGVDGVLDRDERVGPRRRRPRCAAAQPRLQQAAVALDPVVVEAADVAHPVAVDVGVEPRRHADQAARPSPTPASP